ncbi:MAG: hypothetical protein PHQ04_08720 [Opitutaceae bacterium]|nr:hypothetical protein [Opitutaceae bacterium]
MHLTVVAALIISLFPWATPAQAKGKGKGGKAPWSMSNRASMGAAQTTQRGTITHFLLNPHGEVDGLLLDNGTEVKWPAHLGTELTATLRPGSTIEVLGYHDRKGNFKAWQIRPANGDRVLHNTPRPAYAPKLPGFLRDARLEKLSASGKIQHVLTGKKGEPRMILLDSGAQIHVPKHAAWIVSRLATQKTGLQAEGYGIAAPHGTVLRATVLTPAGEAPIPLYAPATR